MESDETEKPGGGDDATEDEGPRQGHERDRSSELSRAFATVDPWMTRQLAEQTSLRYGRSWTRSASS